MAVEDVVTVLTEYLEDGEESFRNLHGPEAVIAVRDIADQLERELGSQLEYGTLWNEFENAPRETAADLSGVLEAMIEADPGLGDKLEVLLEEYYATTRSEGPMVGEEMPESKTSEFVPREEPRIERQEAEPLGHTDVAGEGTYLYGNVRAADVTVEKALELGPDVLNVHRELEMLSFDVGELFDQLHARADEREELSDEIKAAFHEALEQLEAELMLGREASEDRIARHLRKMEALDPGFLELVLAGLRHTRTEAQFLVQSAIDRMSG